MINKIQTELEELSTLVDDIFKKPPCDLCKQDDGCDITEFVLKAVSKIYGIKTDLLEIQNVTENELLYRKYHVLVGLYYTKLEESQELLGKYKGVVDDFVSISTSLLDIQKAMNQTIAEMETKHFPCREKPLGI